MDTLYFARNYRNLEKQDEQIKNGFLAFVAENLQNRSDLITAEKYTLLTAFVEDITGDREFGPITLNIFDRVEIDKTAAKLANIHNDLMSDYKFTEKMEDIRIRTLQLDEESRKWDSENLPKSPLLPN